MNNNFSYFKDFYASIFQVDDKKNTATLKFSTRSFDLKKITLKDIPDSFIFNDFELVGLYTKNTVKSFTFELLSKIGEQLFSFRFKRTAEKLIFEGCYYNGSLNRPTVLFNDNDPYSKRNKIAVEFFKHKEEIIELINNIPSERLINLLHKAKV